MSTRNRQKQCSNGVLSNGKKFILVESGNLRASGTKAWKKREKQGSCVDKCDMCHYCMMILSELRYLYSHDLGEGYGEGVHSEDGGSTAL
jgi:hypothetical protein